MSSPADTVFGVRAYQYPVNQSSDFSVASALTNREELSRFRKIHTTTPMKK